jgi:hypothetical protein
VPPTADIGQFRIRPYRPKDLGGDLYNAPMPRP